MKTLLSLRAALVITCYNIVGSDVVSAALPKRPSSNNGYIIEEKVAFAQLVNNAYDRRKTDVGAQQPWLLRMSHYNSKLVPMNLRATPRGSGDKIDIEDVQLEAEEALKAAQAVLDATAKRQQVSKPIDPSMQSEAIAAVAGSLLIGSILGFVAVEEIPELTLYVDQAIVPPVSAFVLATVAYIFSIQSENPVGILIRNVIGKPTKQLVESTKQSIVDSATSTAESIAAIPGRIVDAATRQVERTAKDIQEFPRKLSNAAAEKVEATKLAVSTRVQETRNAAQQKVKATTERIKQLPARITAAAVDVAEDIVDDIKETPGRVAQTAKDVLEQTVDSTTEIINQTVDSTKKQLKQAVQDVKDLPSKTVDGITKSFTSATTNGSNGDSAISNGLGKSNGGDVLLDTPKPPKFPPPPPTSPTTNTKEQQQDEKLQLQKMPLPPPTLPSLELPKVTLKPLVPPEVNLPKLPKVSLPEIRAPKFTTTTTIGSNDEGKKFAVLQQKEKDSISAQIAKVAAEERKRKETEAAVVKVKQQAEIEKKKEQQQLMQVKQTQQQRDTSSEKALAEKQVAAANVAEAARRKREAETIQRNKEKELAEKQRAAALQQRQRQQELAEKKWQREQDMAASGFAMADIAARKKQEEMIKKKQEDLIKKKKLEELIKKKQLEEKQKAAELIERQREKNSAMQKQQAEQERLRKQAEQEQRKIAEEARQRRLKLDNEFAKKKKLEMERTAVELKRRKEAEARFASAAKQRTTANIAISSGSTSVGAGKIAPRGVGTIVRWRKRPDGGISGRIYGSSNFKDGERIETSEIVNGVIANGNVVKTGSGSRYFLSETVPGRDLAEPPLQALLNSLPGATIQLTKFAKDRDAKAAIDAIQQSKTKSSTFSIFRQPDADATVPSKANLSKSQSVVSSSQRVNSGVRKVAPPGVPTIKRWRKNSDGSISGLIFGSRSFLDGEKVTTSAIRNGEMKSGETVRTGSGSRYFLD